MSLYRKIFENAMTTDAPDIDPEKDAETFKNGFDDESNYNDLESETQGLELSEEDIEKIVERSKYYNNKIDNFIVLLKKIQEDVLKGRYRNIDSKGLDKFANIIKDLQDLGTELTAGINDALIKRQSKDSE